MSERKNNVQCKPRRRHDYKKDNARKRAFNKDIDTAAKLKGILASTLKAKVDVLGTNKLVVVTTKNGKSK
jgi:hypothetical protein